MISDLALAQACADIYDKGIAWDSLWFADDVYVGLRRAEEFDIIAFRGSETPEDWVRDFKGWPEKHPELGYCHDGFLDGMDDVAKEIAPVTGGRPLAVTGHSLGAARALILAGLLTTFRRPPSIVVTFGTPRPGFAKLSRILNGGGFPIRCYKNRSDPVTDVPWLMGMYRRPVEQTMLDVAPLAGDIGPLADHHIGLYLDGVRAAVSTPRAPSH